MGNIKTLAVAVAATLFAGGLLGALFYTTVAFFWQWEMVAALAGVVVTCIGYAKLVRQELKAHLGKMLFILIAASLPAATFVRQILTDTYPLGNDLAGGVELLYQLNYASLDKKIEYAASELDRLTREGAEEREVNQARLAKQTLEASRKTAHEKAAEVVRRRVDPTGTKGIPVTTYAGGTRIRIQLPKASPAEAERIKTAIRTQGNLTFHLVNDSEKDMQDARAGKQVPGHTLMYRERQNVYSREVTKEPILVKTLPEMDGSQIALAVDRFGEEGPEVGVRFTPAGATRFEQLTGANVGRRLAIVLDGRVVSDPKIKERIAGECRISGSFTVEEAKDLAAVLTAGSLPVDVQLESEYVMGPSLGRESIRNGIIASLVGAVAVVLFMVAYYRVGGIVATICLFLCLCILVGAMGFFKATLTMPGIAGIVLTLGMAVDANVLICERIREERERGRPLRMAVQAAFDRVYVTVLASQLTTLVAAIILYYLGSGPVRGFAVTLSIGVLVSLFANLWCSKVFTEWLVHNDIVRELRFARLFPKTNFDFLGIRRPAMAASLAIVLLSVVIFAIRQKDVYDVDFTGGAVIQINFLRPMDPEKVRPRVLAARPKLREELAATAAKLKEISAEAAGKDPAEIRGLLTKKLPAAAEEIFGETAEVTAEGLRDAAAKLEEHLPRIDSEQFVVAAVWSAEEGANRSFTITTRLSDPIILAALKRAILVGFQGDVGAEPFEVSGDRLIVRLAPEAAAGEGGGGDKPIAALKAAISATAGRTDLKAFESDIARLAAARGETKGTGGEPEYS
ncbi:MAG: protein translocase subunit SecD, partial [Planctomycetota bacterium]|nr:protein translocase subunit SecD [Planctomycetota bacterium]